MNNSTSAASNGIIIMRDICRDLSEEYENLDKILAGLKEEEWEVKTPFFDWTVKDQLSHLAYFEGVALMAAEDREKFKKAGEEFLKKLTPGDDLFRVVNNMTKDTPPKKLLQIWRDRRLSLLEKLEALNAGVKLPWFGPDMSARSFATARLMEVWAHGLDVADAFKIRPVPTSRLKNVAHLGISAMKWSFVCRQIKPPSEPVRAELTAPSGEIWTWGPQKAENKISGSAEEFCLVVTQRRNVADTKLKYQGEITSRWLKIAQAFAGPPQDPPAPGERAVEY